MLGAWARLYNSKPKEVACCLSFAVLKDQDDHRNEEMDSEDLCRVPGRALKLGILEVSEHVAVGVPMFPRANIRDKDINIFQDRIWNIAAMEEIDTEFQRVCPKILEFCTYHLVPGRRYYRVLQPDDGFSV